MKADLSAILVIGAIGFVVGGIYVWVEWEDSLPDDARYERDLDVMLDRKLEAVGLDHLPGALAPYGDTKLVVLRALYTDREQRARLNQGFVALRGDWVTSYPLFAEQAGQRYEDGRLEAEIDERLGDGAYDLMARQYDGPVEPPHPPGPQPLPGTRDRRACERTARQLQAYVVCNTPQGRYTVDGRR